MQFSLCRNKLHTAWNSACDACEAATNSPGQGAFVASATSKRMVLELYCQPNCRSVSKVWPTTTVQESPSESGWSLIPALKNLQCLWNTFPVWRVQQKKQRYESLNGLQKMAKRVGLEHVLSCTRHDHREALNSSTWSRPSISFPQASVRIIRGEHVWTQNMYSTIFRINSMSTGD